MIRNNIIQLAPMFLTAVLILFVYSNKWEHDKILVMSLISSIFCLFSFALGNSMLAVVTICTSQTVLVVYSMFFRRGQ